MLARLIQRLDERGASAIALDFAFLRPSDPDRDQHLTSAVRSARARVILGVDESFALNAPEREFQRIFLSAMGRPMGFSTLSKDLDDIIRRVPAPFPGSLHSKPFAAVIADAQDAQADRHYQSRIVWLGRPRNGSDAFLTLPASLVLEGSGTETQMLKDRIVIIGRVTPGSNVYKTPLASAKSGAAALSGVMVQAHIAAQILDGRGINELEPMWVGAVTASLGVLLGWLLGRFRLMVFVVCAAFGLCLLLAFFSWIAASRFYVPWGVGVGCWFLGLSAGRMLRTGRSASTARPSV